MTNENCIFCKIIEGKIPAVKVWEDEKYLTMLDINPMNPGHVLIIPKEHEDYIFDLSDSKYKELMLKAKNVAIILKERLKPKRVALAVEGLGIPHVHVHLVPINKGNELNPERAKPMNSEELNRIAKKIRGN